LYKGSNYRAEAAVLQLAIAKKGTTKTHVVDSLCLAIDDLWPPAADEAPAAPEVTEGNDTPSMRAR
jgi:hypothetical protein